MSFLLLLIIVCWQFTMRECRSQVMQLNPFSNSLENLELINEDKQQPSNDCMCIPIWQCKSSANSMHLGGISETSSRILLESIRRKQRSPYAGRCKGYFEVCCTVECGRGGNLVAGVPDLSISASAYPTRVLNRDPLLGQTQFAEFPWMLALVHNQQYKCGASLIHPQVAITAAHCLDNTLTYLVRAGEWNWADNDERIEHQDRFVQRIIVHPMYYPAALYNDIAILLLDRPFNLAENVNVVCLPSAARFADPKDITQRTDCIATGWGKNSFEAQHYEMMLKKVELPLVDMQICENNLRKARLGPFFQLHPSFLCAGGQQQKDTCKGDGGGPLICPIQGDIEQRYEQVGIVSWGLSCGQRNTPGVYVNVGLFREWIDMELTKHKFDVNVYKFRS